MRKAPAGIPLSQFAAYGLGGIYGGGSLLIIDMFFLFFLVEMAGMSPLLGGLVMALGKVWDAFSDPLMAGLSDRTESPWGRRRFYILLGAVPAGIGFSVLWILPGIEGQGGLFLYYGAAYILFSTSYTAVMVPYTSLNSELRQDYRGRRALAGARIVFSHLAALGAGVLPRLIIEAGGGQAAGYLGMGISFGGAYTLVWFLMLAGTGGGGFRDGMAERLRIRSGKGTRGENFLRYWRLLENRSFRILLGMCMAAFSALDLLIVLFVFYLYYYIGLPELYPAVMAVLMTAQLAVLPVYIRVGKRRGNGFAFSLGLAVLVLALAGASLINPSTPPAVILGLAVLLGMGLSAVWMTPWASLPAAADVDELIAGRRRISAYSGALVLMRKVVQGAVAMPLAGAALEILGFGRTQGMVLENPSVWGLKTFFLLAPLLLAALALWLARHYPLNPRSLALVEEELERVSQGGSLEDADPLHRQVCEEVTGKPYEELFPGLRPD